VLAQLGYLGALGDVEGFLHPLDTADPW